MDQNQTTADYGYIVVKAVTAGGALPVERAVVTVRDLNDRILSVMFTDRSGLTTPLKVLAPPKSNSSAPNTGLPPFYAYNIDTDKEGFISVRNIDVPVYPGITSVQTVELVPLSEGNEGNQSGDIVYNEGFPPDL
jgi:hypothetical protein